MQTLEKMKLSSREAGKTSLIAGNGNASLWGMLRKLPGGDGIRAGCHRTDRTSLAMEWPLQRPGNVRLHGEHE